MASIGSAGIISSSSPFSVKPLCPTRRAASTVKVRAAAAKYKGTHLREKHLTEMIEKKVEEANHLCQGDARSDDAVWYLPSIEMGGLPLQNDSCAVALSGSAQSQGSTIATPAPESKPKKKICCACPETKKLRDECIVENGEDACAKWIEAHRVCLRAGGFNI